MDLDQLQLILQTIESAGDGAFWLAAFWIFVDGALPVFGFLAFLITAYAITTRVLRDMGIMGKLYVLRRRLNTGSAGYMTDSELERTINRVLEITSQNNG